MEVFHVLEFFVEVLFVIMLGVVLGPVVILIGGLQLYLMFRFGYWLFDKLRRN